MRAMIAEQFRLATLPVRRCADLRRITCGIRAAADSGRQLRRAGVRFPASLLGGELVALMGARFRDRLRQAGGSAEQAAYLRETQRVFAAPTAAERSGTAWNAPADGARPGPRLAAVPAKNTGSSSVSSAEPANLRQPQPPAWPERFPASAGSRPWNSPQGEAATPASWPGPASAAGQQRGPEPVSAMAKQLREYWRLEPRNAAPAASGVPASEAHTPEKGRTAEALSGLRQSPVQALRPGQASFAERLQSFVTGRGEPPEHHPRAAWQETAEPATAARPFRQEASTAGGVALAGEFADRLSETLFTQAVQHGIDVT